MKIEELRELINDICIVGNPTFYEVLSHEKEEYIQIDRYEVLNRYDLDNERDNIKIIINGRWMNLGYAIYFKNLSIIHYLENVPKWFVDKYKLMEVANGCGTCNETLRNAY